MSYSEEEYLMISGLQHFEFCRRQWALIHIENVWDDNVRTVEGNILHLDDGQCKMLQKRLLDLMNKDLDSLRFYYLGNKYQTKIEHFGVNEGYDPEGFLDV